MAPHSKGGTVMLAGEAGSDRKGQVRWPLLSPKHPGTMTGSSVRAHVGRHRRDNAHSLGWVAASWEGHWALSPGMWSPLGSWPASNLLLHLGLCNQEVKKNKNKKAITPQS